MGLRRKARECSLQILYSADICKMSLDEAMKAFWQKHAATKNVMEYAVYLARGTTEHVGEIDAIIKKLSENWELNRLAAVDRNIMRQACFEILYNSEVPYKVAINEAIELAKEYGTGDSGKFVNGILDKIKESRDDGKK
jgi:transcription antitermination factor NusB